MLRLKRKGFTLVEIMIVVAIIGLLAAIAIPNFATARDQARTNTCRANLRTIQSAVTLAEFEGAAGTIASAGQAELDAALAPTYLMSMPTCPSDDAEDNYSTDANGVVQCTEAGHTI